MDFVDLEKTNRKREEEYLNLQRKKHVFRKEIRNFLLKLKGLNYDKFMILRNIIEQEFQKYTDLLYQLNQSNQIYIFSSFMNKFIVFLYINTFRNELLFKMRCLNETYFLQLIHQKCYEILQMARIIKDQKIQKILINFLKINKFI